MEEILKFVSVVFIFQVTNKGQSFESKSSGASQTWHKSGEEATNNTSAIQTNRSSEKGNKIHVAALLCFVISHTCSVSLDRSPRSMFCHATVYEHCCKHILYCDVIGDYIMGSLFKDMLLHLSIFWIDVCCFTSHCSGYWDKDIVFIIILFFWSPDDVQ
jgi:hypothetical protein